MKLKHVGMIVVSVLAMSSAAVSAAEGDESVTTDPTHVIWTQA
ncbi:pilus assembly protein [Escherichia coli]|nr:pilus assembly protein [Escherichia coli]